MSKKRILLLAPPYMDIYKDIIKCLESKEYDVVWISDGLIPGNPYNKGDLNRHTKTVSEYQAEVDAFWNNTFKNDHFDVLFDYFLAIDGFMVTPFFFNLLEKLNPNIRKVLYLYDRVEGNYEIDMFFKYYTAIFSFDLGDCSHFGLCHLPIYWVPSVEYQSEEYDIFGMGGFQWGTRYDVYRSLKKLSKSNGLKDYIKLYLPPIHNKCVFLIKYTIKKFQRKQCLSLSELNDDLFTNVSLSPSDFRKMILKSKVILDTQNSNQDGMTARFMWALGSEKKIITTNKSVIRNPFYSPEQIFILDKDNYDGIMKFIEHKYIMPDNIRSIVRQYRIDNWLDTLLLKK